MKAIAIAALFALCGCASAPLVPVPLACTPNIGPEPVYPDTDDALAAADIVPATQLLLAGRALRNARIETLKAALEACKG
ncbi:MAG: hypothetical protein JOZ27_02155 [Caulobacteraceae bacterium]|nr:hypothetical protein [Caulobacteraceae bacterium]